MGGKAPAARTLPRRARLPSTARLCRVRLYAPRFARVSSVNELTRAGSRRSVAEIIVGLVPRGLDLDHVV